MRNESLGCTEEEAANPQLQFFADLHKKFIPKIRRLKKIKKIAEIHEAYESNFDRLMNADTEEERQIYRTRESQLNKEDIFFRKKYNLDFRNLGD